MTIERLLRGKAAAGMARLFFACYLVAQLADCAAMPDSWDEYPTLKPLPAVIIRLPASEVTRICGKRTMGCAERDYAAGVCIVRVDVRPLPDTIPHELLHCAGFEHRP